MAEKVILELKDKDFVKNYAGKTITASANMGYNSNQIDRVLQDLPDGMNSAEAIIPYVIQNLK